jgi:hypothetical protein
MTTLCMIASSQQCSHALKAEFGQNGTFTQKLYCCPEHKCSQVNNVTGREGCEETLCLQSQRQHRLHVLKIFIQLQLEVTGVTHETETMSCLTTALALKKLSQHANEHQAKHLRIVCRTCR